jgi:hypothetical protein
MCVTWVGLGDSRLLRRAHFEPFDGFFLVELLEGKGLLQDVHYEARLDIEQQQVAADEPILEFGG